MPTAPVADVPDVPELTVTDADVAAPVGEQNQITITCYPAWCR